MTAISHSWLSRIDLGPILEQVGTPVFIYNEDQLAKNIGRVKDAAEAAGLGERVELYIPFFPNSNPHVLKPVQEMGAGILLQLPGEYRVLSEFGFDKFIVSPGHVSDEEIGFWNETGYPTFLASIDEVSYSLRTNAPSISVRIDSLDSGKPGIKYSDLEELSNLLNEYGRGLESLEVYCGSGNSLDEMVNIIEQILVIFQQYFPYAQSVNFAGGHGFIYEAWDEEEKHFDWTQYFQKLREIATRMGIPEHVKFLFEPARDVLADTGAILLSVERGVITTSVSNIVVTNGSRMLMPSAQLRSRRHNVSFLNAEMEEIRSNNPDSDLKAALRGRTILRHDYILPGEYSVPPGVDNSSYVAILDVGAYCATQHMEFLNVPPPAEVLVAADGAAHLISSRGDDLDKWRNLLSEKEELRRWPNSDRRPWEMTSPAGKE